ncbi:MAG: hypothetical protein EBS24_02065 [Chitinophagia bacterium]|nr:hypothetical protein [Chitinophagia bacterium]
MKRLVFLAGLVLFVSCIENKSEPKLGRINIQVSCNEAAQKLFQEGLAYLHSFEYLDARETFLKAQQADPECGMAYWGEIMAYNHPLFNRELVSLAQQAFNRMGSTPGDWSRLFASDMEKDFLKGIQLLFGEGSKEARDKAYRDHCAEMALKYPGNHEIKAFYALSLLSSPRTEKTLELYEKAAQINKEILAENPDHPGALHYLIHSYDYPSHAHLAKEAADNYAVVAPDAEHALHMPSHIYFAMGRWNDVINSNIESWNASVKATKLQPRKQLGFHSLAWLHYGLLQRAEFDLADKVIWDMMTYAQIDQSTLARTYMISMKGIHMVETDTWDGDLADYNLKIADLHLTRRSAFRYLVALRAYRKGQASIVRDMLEKIANENYMASLDVGNMNVIMCNTAGNPNIPPNQLDIDLVSIMELQLKACLAQLEGDEQRRLQYLEEAYKIFDAMNLISGPPVVFESAYESYAKALIDNNSLDRALEVVNKAMIRAPRKYSLLLLQKDLAERLGLNALLEKVNAELEISISPQERKEILSYES